MISDVYIDIHTDSNGTITAPSAFTDLIELNNQTRGGQATFDFDIVPDNQTLVVAAGETYTIESGTTEIYSEVTVDGTLNVDGTLIVTGTGNFNTIQDYTDHAGQATVVETLGDKQYYKESNRLPTGADINSLLLGIEPSPTLQNEGINGVWGLVVGGGDIRPRAISTQRYQLSVTVLAEYGDYNDRSAVKNDLEL